MKHVQGHNSTIIQLNNLYVRIGMDVVACLNTILLEVAFYWEAAIASTEDEPGCDEYFDIHSIIPLSYITLVNEEEDMTLDLSNRTNLVNILTDTQIEGIISELKKQREEDDGT